MSLQYQTLHLSTGLKPHVICCFSPVPARASIVFLHGFPGTNEDFRHLLKPLASQGYDCYSPTMRGYGPHDKDLIKEDKDLALENVCEDILALLYVLDIDRVILVGHDWGGMCVWTFCNHYPQRVKACAVFCTPFYPCPKENPWPKLRRNPGRFTYQVVFQDDHAAHVLERDIEASLRMLINSSKDSSGLDSTLAHELGFATEGVEGTGATSSSTLLSRAQMNMYIAKFRESGFLNPIRWYRNVERNWEWNKKHQGKEFLRMPALMVTAEHDHILKPSMTHGMERYFENLHIVHMKDCNHWILHEKPGECIHVLSGWLANMQVNAKL